MKKALVFLLVVAMTFGLLVGCTSAPETTEPEAPATEETTEETPATEEGTTEEATAGYEDGIYFAQEEQFSETSGWKYMVTLEIQDGAIITADWNGANVNAGPDKKTLSQEGGYQMVEFGGAQAEWHEQAAAVEAYLLETQDPAAINYTDDEGHTDDITGVSIHVSEFYNLVNEALENGPTEPGIFVDGSYHAEEPEFADSGWKYTADFTVVNGNLVAVNWNGVHKDGGDDKKTVSINGEYGMVENAGAQAEWHEQAMAAEAHLLEIQDPALLTYSDDEGHTDEITGVSIHVNALYDMANEVLVRR